MDSQRFMIVPQDEQERLIKDFTTYTKFRACDMHELLNRPIPRDSLYFMIVVEINDIYALIGIHDALNTAGFKWLNTDNYCLTFKYEPYRLEEFDYRIQCTGIKIKQASLMAHVGLTDEAQKKITVKKSSIPMHDNKGNLIRVPVDTVEMDGKGMSVLKLDKKSLQNVDDNDLMEYVVSHIIGSPGENFTTVETNASNADLAKIVEKELNDPNRMRGIPFQEMIKQKIEESQ